MPWIHPHVLRDTVAGHEDRGKSTKPEDWTAMRGNNGSGRLADMSQMPQLRGITLDFWSHPDLSDLLTLPNRDRLFSRLTFYSCIVLDTAPLAQCRGLRSVGFRYSQTHDLRPIADLPKLRMLTVKGCALDEYSFRTLLPQLRAAGIKFGQSGELQEHEWLLMQQTKARGLTVCIFENDYGQMMVRAPGEKSSTMTYTYCNPENVGEILDAFADLDDWRFYDASETWAKLTEYCRAHERALRDDRVSNDAYAERVKHLRGHVRDAHERFEPFLTSVWKTRFLERFPVVERG